MGKQIIPQPKTDENNEQLYAVFSTNTNSFHIWNATEEQVITFFLEGVLEEAERQARNKMADVKQFHADPKTPYGPYAQFAWTWEDAVEEHNENSEVAYQIKG